LAHHTIQPVPVKPWQEWALAVGVAALAVLASWVGIRNGFTYDDVYIVEKNQVIRSLGNWWKLFGQSYWPEQWGSDGYRPLTVLAFMLEHAAAGGKVWIYHAANIALYAVSAVMVFFLARTVLPVAAALLAAALFAVHPVHVEAVASIVGQAELLVAVFVIPAVTLYINGRNGEGLTLARQVGIGVLFVLACFAKEHGIVLPVLLLAAELIAVNDKASIAKRFVQLRPFVLALTAIGLAYLAAHQYVARGTSMGFHPYVAFSTNGVGSSGRMWTMFGFVPDWIRLFLWPARLTAEYGPPEYPVVRGFAPYQVPGMLIMAAALALVFVAARRKSRAVAFGLAFAIVALLPTSNFIVAAGLLLAERTLFLPSVGAMIAVGACVPWVYKRIKPAPVQLAIAAGFTVIIGLGIWRSYTRSQVWKDNDTLFSAGVVDAPNVYRAHYVLGAWHFQQKRKVLGERYYMRSLELYDRDPYVYLNLGLEYENFGMYRSAVPYMRRVLALDSTFVEARSALALALTMTGQYDEAEMQAKRALREYTRSGNAMRWALDVINRYRATGAPPPMSSPPPRVSPNDTGSASSKVPSIMQKAAQDSGRPPQSNSQHKQ
jgi:tetratricopeptide (TPR) repeat protein